MTHPKDDSPMIVTAQDGRGSAAPVSQQAAAADSAFVARRAASWLLAQRKADGHWVGELEGDTILETEWVLLKAFLGELDDPEVVAACRSVRRDARPEGGWAIYPGGPFEISASVKAYFALKLVGVSPDEPDMVRARELILQHGGLDACNSFTRFYLALLGQIPYDDCPAVPPELVWLPSWVPFSLAAMSSWTRTLVVPLAILSSLKPCRPVPDALRIDELKNPHFVPDWRKPAGLFTWRGFFLGVDRLLKAFDRIKPGVWRRAAVRSCHQWMLDHFEDSDGLGAIFPPMIYTVIVLETLGYDRNDRLFEWAVRQLDDLKVRDEENGLLWLQPCLSPVWDTAIATIALADVRDAQAENNPAARAELETALTTASRWLVAREIRRKGDWAIRRRFRHIEPSGWAFEYLNDHYADIDDTAMVLMALDRAGLRDDPTVKPAIERALNWLLALQGRDGAWAAFDADIDNQVLTQVPFADHNAMLDPGCADITARVVEMLGQLGFASSHPSIQRALEFIWSRQEPEGWWEGRWGVNAIYGTWQVLQGLAALGWPMSDPRLVKAADWLETIQQADGGFGESCRSYEDRSWIGQGPPTPSQTAWGLLGLIAAGRADSPAAHRAAAWLRDRQTSHGDWPEDQFTGTGFPKVFYLKYHLYRVSFPIMALARHARALTRRPS